MKVILNSKPHTTKVTLVNYSNRDYLKSQKKNNRTGLLIGDFEKTISYSDKDIDKQFYNKNKEILKQKRGNGYWLWKPYFIKKTLDQMNDGEVMFYCDSGSHFISSIKELLPLINNQDIVPFELQQNDSFWTKRDTFFYMNCDAPFFSETKQRLASFAFFRKSDFTMQFINDWLNFATDERIITDIENQCKLLNFPEFIEHRHDQSIFSLLTKKYNLKAFRDPSQFGNNFRNLYLTSKYPQIIISTRQKDLSILRKIKKLAKLYIPKNILVFYRKLKNIK